MHVHSIDFYLKALIWNWAARLLMNI